VPVVLDLARRGLVKGMANITGGGLPGNLNRTLPARCDARIDPASWPRPAVFSFMQERGPVEEDEMFRVFNMGIGYVLVVAPDFAGSIAAKLTRCGEKVYTIGTVTQGTGQVVLKD